MKNAKLKYVNPFRNEPSLSFHPSDLCLWWQVREDSQQGLGGRQQVQLVLSIVLIVCPPSSTVASTSLCWYTIDCSLLEKGG